LQQVKEMNVQLHAVIIPVGGGGLASGNIITLRALLGDSIKIILAEPAKLDDAKRSFEAGQLLKHAPDNKLDSVADGLKTTLGLNTWPVVRDMVDDVMTVTEEEILRATKIIWERLKVTIEPSAGVGVAVALSDPFQKKYPVDSGFQNVGVILCGGNVDIVKIASLMHDMGL
jgi:threonine dehydratase